MTGRSVLCVTQREPRRKRLGHSAVFAASLCVRRNRDLSLPRLKRAQGDESLNYRCEVEA
nr:MAG TPA_asm: hypothetical protein [Caudoviricetes sp.]